MKKIDQVDVFTFGGLAVAAVGIWMLSPPAALIVVGTVLFWLGIRGGSR